MPPEAPEAEEGILVTAYHCTTLERDASGALGMIPIPSHLLKALGWKDEEALELMVIDGGQVLVRSRGFNVNVRSKAAKRPVKG